MARPTDLFKLHLGYKHTLKNSPFFDLFCGWMFMVNIYFQFLLKNRNVSIIHL